MIDTRAYRGADIGSDHNLVIAKIKLKLCRVAKPMGMSEKYDVHKMRNPQVRKEFVLKLRNRFSCLAEEGPENENETLNKEEDNSLEGCWKRIEVAYNVTAKKVLGYRKRKSKVWISVNSWKEIGERRKLKEEGP